MAKAPQTKEPNTMVIDALKRGRTTFKIIGDTPMFYNAMSAKAKRDLLIGGGKKTAAEKKNIKHDPETEFYNSTYRTPLGPTLLCFPAAGVKKAMGTAALVTDGIKKTDVARMIFLPQEKISVWGKPLLRMDVVRSADMNRTPDVRTRAFLPRWCATIDIAYIVPQLSQYSVASLLLNAGVVAGIGDFRQEKGAGSYGTFRLLNEDNEADVALWEELTTTEGREAQQEALEHPMAADEDTNDLWTMLRQERLRRAA